MNDRPRITGRVEAQLNAQSLYAGSVPVAPSGRGGTAGGSRRLTALFPKGRERFIARGERAVHVGVRVRERDVELLVRVDEDAALDQLDRPAQMEFLVRCQQVGPGPQRPPVREAHTEDRVLPRRLRREAVAPADRLDLAAEPSANAVEMVVGAGPAEHVERDEACG